jgi:hypothetical protein
MIFQVRTDILKLDLDARMEPISHACVIITTNSCARLLNPTRSSVSVVAWAHLIRGCSSAKEHGFKVVVRRQIPTGGGALAVAGVGATYFGLRQMGSIEEYNASIAATRASLSQTPEMRDFIRYATLAANSHNTQPWRFRASAQVKWKSCPTSRGESRARSNRGTPFRARE